MGPVTASTVEEVSAEGEEDPQPDSTSGDKLQVTSSSEVVKKQVDGGDMDTLEVHPVDNELRDLVHEDGTCASTGGEMPAKRRRLDVKKEEADPGVSSLSTFTNSDGISQLQKAAVKPTALDEESLSSKPEPDSHRHSLSSPLLTPTGHTRRSISMEVDDDYEKQRIQKEKEREELRQQIEARKKEEARLAAKEAEEKRHQRELEREAKRHHREQERLSKQDELLVKQIEEKKRIEDIRKEAKERRLLGDTPVAKPEGVFYCVSTFEFPQHLHNNHPQTPPSPLAPSASTTPSSTPLSLLPPSPVAPSASTTPGSTPLSLLPPSPVAPSASTTPGSTPLSLLPPSPVAPFLVTPSSIAASQLHHPH
jgi:hypothetical protein